jgi:hypothetical protein
MPLLRAVENDAQARAGMYNVYFVNGMGLKHKAPYCSPLVVQRLMSVTPVPPENIATRVLSCSAGNGLDRHAKRGVDELKHLHVFSMNVAERWV